jgi:hypothetical protein
MLLPNPALLIVCTRPVLAEQLRVYHIDVEQASSTLFVAPGGKTLRIDSGKNGMGSRIKAVMDRAGVTQIDFFVDTPLSRSLDGLPLCLGPFCRNLVTLRLCQNLSQFVFGKISDRWASVPPQGNREADRSFVCTFCFSQRSFGLCSEFHVRDRKLDIAQLNGC